MNFTQHISNNDVLHPPKGASNEECRPLPITRVDLGDESRADRHVVSFWLPDREELASLLAGRPVMLYVQGDTHPPLFMTVESRHAQG